MITIDVRSGEVDWQWCVIGWKRFDQLVQIGFKHVACLFCVILQCNFTHEATVARIRCFGQRKAAWSIQPQVNSSVCDTTIQSPQPIQVSSFCRFSNLCMTLALEKESSQEKNHDRKPLPLDWPTLLFMVAVHVGALFALLPSNLNWKAVGLMVFLCTRHVQVEHQLKSLACLSRSIQRR